MATKLDRDLTRETTLNVNDKQIMITITKNQSILLKLKGERGKHYEINILEHTAQSLIWITKQKLSLTK
jgi:hypothetical protein